LLVLLTASACKQQGIGPNAAHAKLDRLRECGLLTPGLYWPEEPWDERAACRLTCDANASCDDLQALECTYDISAALQACYDACDPPPLICPDGEELPGSYRCDGFDDCADGSDEVGCPAEQVWTCADGVQTIRQDWWCDAFDDCADGSDEQGCPADRVFTCADGSDTVRADWRCDGFGDCADHSDEQDCPAGTLFECADGSDTIPMRDHCDGWTQCNDGSDERDCPAGTSFTCADGSKTIPLRWQCDHFDDCADASDEVGCAELICGP
jgi:hypothetical protein